MLQPKRVKYRRPHIIKYEGKSKAGNNVDFGEFGLEALEGAWITARQIESARIAINRYLKRGGDVVIRIFPHKPITKRPAEVRMGKGKGPLEGYVAPVKEGTVLYEIGGVDEALAREAFRRASHKLPVKTKIIVRQKDAETQEVSK